jgi:hypothetical protein
MKMKQVKFNELSVIDRALLVAEFGHFIKSCEYNEYRVHLYRINHQYIEVYYNIYTRCVENILLAKYADLDKHIINVDLRNLVE